MRHNPQIIFIEMSAQRGNALPSPSHLRATGPRRPLNTKLIGQGDISHEKHARSAPPPPTKTEKISCLSWSCCLALEGGELLLSGRGSNLCSCET